MTDELMTMGEAVKHLGMPRHRIVGLVNSGQIRGWRTHPTPHGHWRLVRDDVHDWRAAPPARFRPVNRGAMA